MTNLFTRKNRDWCPNVACDWCPQSTNFFWSQLFVLTTTWYRLSCPSYLGVRFVRGTIDQATVHPARTICLQMPMADCCVSCLGQSVTTSTRLEDWFFNRACEWFEHSRVSAVFEFPAMFHVHVNVVQISERLWLWRGIKNQSCLWKSNSELSSALIRLEVPTQFTTPGPSFCVLTTVFNTRPKHDGKIIVRLVQRF